MHSYIVANNLPEPRRILGVDDPGLARHRGGIRVQDQVLELADVAVCPDVPAAVPQRVRRAGRLLRLRGAREERRRRGVQPRGRARRHAVVDGLEEAALRARAHQPARQLAAPGRRRHVHRRDNAERERLRRHLPARRRRHDHGTVSCTCGAGARERERAGMAVAVAPRVYMGVSVEIPLGMLTVCSGF
jgi:hypothetical protein